MASAVFILKGLHRFVGNNVRMCDLARLQEYIRRNFMVKFQATLLSTTSRNDKAQYIRIYSSFVCTFHSLQSLLRTGVVRFFDSFLCPYS